MWVLTQGEIDLAASAADQYAKECLKRNDKVAGMDLAYEQIYMNASAVEILCRACRRATDTTRPVFMSPKLVRQKFTVDEISVLALKYKALQNKLGPIVTGMTKPEMDAWLEKLGRGGSQFPLAYLSSEQLQDLVMHSASRLYPSSMDTGSPGSPPDEPSPSSSNDSQLPPQPAESPLVVDEFADADRTPITEGEP
jgi:hypothetical protein